MKAAFCGSFDPITLGHLDLIVRASRIFDHLTVFVTDNSAKKESYSARQKALWIEESTRDLENVSVAIQKGLATEACAKAGAKVLIRGIRNETDMAYEANMAFLNTEIAPDIETVCLFCRADYTFISSSNIRELLKYNQSIQRYVPECVFRDLQPEMYKESMQNLHEHEVG